MTRHRIATALPASLLLSLASPAAHAVDGPIAISTSSIDFGQVNVGSTGQASATLTNIGASPFGPINMFGGAPPSAEFGASQNCQGNTLPAGGSCTVSYEFSPGSAGVFNDSSSFRQRDKQPARRRGFQRQPHGRRDVRLALPTAGVFLAMDADGTVYSGNLVAKGERGTKLRLFLDGASGDALAAEVAARAGTVAGRSPGTALGQSSKLTLRLRKDGSVALALKSEVLTSGLGEVVFKANLSAAAPAQ